jgi:hypothetical protein
MGAWSYEPFGNDTAGDWVYGLVESRDLLYLEATLDKVLETGSLGSAGTGRTTACNSHRIIIEAVWRSNHDTEKRGAG